jgi:hypothetical protein
MLLSPSWRRLRVAWRPDQCSAIPRDRQGPGGQLSPEFPSALPESLRSAATFGVPNRRQEKRQGANMRIEGYALAALLIAAPVTAQVGPEPGDSGLFFRTVGDGYAPATRLGSSFEIEVTGIVARVAVTQRFRNEGRDWVEGVYVFPLPDDAAVDELTLVIGDRRIEGEIQEREQAKRTYEQARDRGQQASLVEQ